MHTVTREEELIEESEAKEAVSKIIIAIVLGIYSIFCWGFTVYKLYWWFIVPIDSTLPVLSYTQAVGIRIFSIALRKTPLIFDSESINTGESMLATIIMPWLVLLVAFIVKLIIS